MLQLPDASLKISTTGTGLNKSRGKVPQAGSVGEQEIFSMSLKSWACIWMTNLCVCPSFMKSFTSGETPGPGLWRLYISIHNWWPGPRQTVHYTCNMDSLLVSDACPRLDLTLSHHCVWRGNGVWVCVDICARESMCLCFMWWLLQPKM